MKVAKDRDQDRVDTAEAALTMAIAVLVERIRGLPKEDKDDLFELSKILFAAESEEELQCAARAYQEILEQKPACVVAFETKDTPVNMGGWLEWISGRIKQAREDARLTQSELEAATGLPQSHISRLENGVHSPSSTTLEKIAAATGKSMPFFDPSHQDEL